jgi:hypothetical protein
MLATWVRQVCYGEWRRVAIMARSLWEVKSGDRLLARVFAESARDAANQAHVGLKAQGRTGSLKVRVLPVNAEDVWPWHQSLNKRREKDVEPDD